MNILNHKILNKDNEIALYVDTNKRLKGFNNLLIMQTNIDIEPPNTASLQTNEPTLLRHRVG